MTKIERYQQIFDDIKIIYCIRDQLEMLISLFLRKHLVDHFHNPVFAKPAWTPTFEQWIDINFRYCSESLLECCKYQLMISGYQERFGKDNVFVYTFDEFRQNPRNILMKVCDFIGTDVNENIISETINKNENRRLSGRHQVYSQLRRRLLPGVRLSEIFPKFLTGQFNKFLSASKDMWVDPDPQTVKRIREYYAADNLKLEKSMGIRLGSGPSD